MEPLEYEYSTRATAIVYDEEGTETAHKESNEEIESTPSSEKSERYLHYYWFD